MDGQLLPVTGEPRYFCRNPEQFGDGTATFRLSTTRPTWWLANELPWMSRAELEQIIQAATDGWSPFANVKATRAPSLDLATWRIEVASIDGPGGVLADMQLPHPTVRQQVMHIDVAESALKDLLVVILMHEFGHAYGLQHFPSAPPPELMEPVLNPAIRAPQPTEAALMAQWYGLPQAESPIPGAPPVEPLVCTTRITPANGKVECAISVQQGQRKAELSGSKNW